MTRVVSRGIRESQNTQSPGLRFLALLTEGYVSSKRQTRLDWRSVSSYLRVATSGWSWQESSVVN
jgi:hypothetical protein